MIDEILELGVTDIELSHGMTVAKLPGIRAAFAGGAFPVSYTHLTLPTNREV